jgi:hypothetical protein
MFNLTSSYLVADLGPHPAVQLCPPVLSNHTDCKLPSVNSQDQLSIPLSPSCSHEGR